ncbi:carbon-nitrogen hydrolase family protein [Magnetospira sp. QH-2]|uniref:carbon-nitrogen hydrolase family protein n=1 Tax=Magnetospira sp. (strain QH-2) TaxID=1288970 RepID=UPI0005FA1B45|nr:carbon-nitrogen hydrolase family protein [Magnetospira sp. QH-2]
MTQGFVAACVQLNNGRETAENLSRVVSMIHQAAETAAFVALPENADRLEPDIDRLRAGAEPEGSHQALIAFRQAAKSSRVWLLVGSVCVRKDDGDLANRSYMINPEGDITARYDKIHMFDVDLANGESYRESDRCTPGDRAVVAETPWGGVGMTVCYDLRFPHLHRDLAKRGAFMLAGPAAFTQRTGEAHWEILLRARAIETGSFVVAPAQCGTHAEGRQTFGHSLIIDPWGKVLVDGGPDPGIVTALIDPDHGTKVRRMIPSLTHDRDFHAG